MDIQAFVQHQERDRKPFLINDTEIDGLVCWLPIPTLNKIKIKNFTLILLFIYIIDNI